MSGWIPVVIFYSIVFLLIYFNRKKFDIQAKFIALYRTKIGIKLMDKIANRFPKILTFLGVIFVILGYAGMLFISYFLVKGFFNFFIKPLAEPVMGLVLPGITTPLWYTIIAIFIVATVHEFSHGVLSRLHNIKIKNTGIVFFGPIIGAFVEPDEKKLVKQKPLKQLSIFAAGPISNLVLGGICLLILLFLFPPIINAHVDFDGLQVVDFLEVNGTSPIKQAGIQKGEIIRSVDGKDVKKMSNLMDALINKTAGNVIIVGTDKDKYDVILTDSLENKTTPFLGVSIKHNYGNLFSLIVMWFYGLLYWVYLLNIGIGLVNLLPLGPVDGGRILHISLLKFFDEKKAYIIWKRISLICLFIIIVNLVFPYIAGFLLR